MKILESSGNATAGFDFAIVMDETNLNLGLFQSVSFSEPPYLLGKDVVTTINEFVDLVKSILERFL